MFALIFGLSFLANAQDVQTNQPKGYQFTDIKRLPATSVKDQARASRIVAMSFCEPRS